MLPTFIFKKRVLVGKQNITCQNKWEVYLGDRVE